MTASTLLIDCPGVWSSTDPDQRAQAWLQRLAHSDVALWAWRADAQDAVPPHCCSPALFSGVLPALMPSMAIMQSRAVSLVGSWLITADVQAARLAAAMGVQGVVMMEGVPLPQGLACTLASARDLADAPRVMIPPSGGCWHDHRTG
ncbi:MAG: hypothetical protein EA401_10295 [Planctomycetota bacterium]|nr:MAG: hypothetical protein EA401_10295 [Planctomycetota bacterium]